MGIGDTCLEEDLGYSRGRGRGQGDGAWGKGLIEAPVLLPLAPGIQRHGDIVYGPNVAQVVLWAFQAAMWGQSLWPQRPKLSSGSLAPER